METFYYTYPTHKKLRRARYTVHAKNARSPGLCFADRSAPISDARLTNWHFPEIIAYYMGVIFTRGRSTVNAKWSRALKVRSGKRMRGKEGGGEGKKEGKKKEETSLQRYIRCVISTDNYIGRLRREQPGHVNINLSRTRTPLLRHSIRDNRLFPCPDRLYNKHLSLFFSFLHLWRVSERASELSWPPHQID